jgi:hypothetical protein
MGHSHEGDTLLATHRTLAIALMAVLGSHVLLALLRPKPDAGGVGRAVGAGRDPGPCAGGARRARLAS